MICPVDLASEMSALQAARVADHGGHGLLLEGRGGAGDESTRCYVASDSAQDHLVSGSGDSWDHGPAFAAVTGALRAVWG